MRRINALLQNIQSISSTILELSIVKPNGQPFFNFTPGQYATLSFPAHEYLRSERSFSIASSAADRSTLRFGIRIGGKYTSALRDLRPGDPVFVRGPFGDFTMDTINDKRFVFLAGGIGVTPFLSMIRTILFEQKPIQLTLFYSVRSLEDAPFRKDLDELEKTYKNFTVIYAVTDKKIPDSTSKYFPGRISKELIIRQLESNPWEQRFFLCGPHPFMKSMMETLNSIGVPESAVRTERFGIGSKAFIEKGTSIPKLAFAAWGVATAVVFAVVVHVEQGRRVTPAGNPQITNTISNQYPATSNSSIRDTSGNTARQIPSQSPTGNTVQQQAPIIPRTTVS